MWLRKFSLIQRLGIIAALITLLFVLLTALVLNRHYEALKQKSYDENQHLVEVVHTLLGSFAKREDVDEATAKQLALEAVKALRYDGNNYFWIQDETPAMVMHPMKPALDGKDLRTFKDGNGKAFFIEMAQKVKAKGEGFVDYVWPLPGEEAPTDKISYVKAFKPWGWTVGSGIYLTNLEEEYAHLRNVIVVFCVVSVVLVILLIYVIGGSIVKPVQEVSERMKDISQGEGDLTRSLPETGQDEVTRLARYFNEYTEKMRQSLLGIRENINSLTQQAELVETSSKNSNAQAQTQNENMLQVAAAMEEMTTQINEVSNNADSAEKGTSSARSNVQHGASVVDSTVQDIRSLTSDIESVSNVVTELAAQTDSIGAVLDVIRGIAEQTNLLALNAAIEAARAGEQGRGFAVVADEVRTLASRTGQSTDEIQAMIEKLQSNAKNAVDAVKVSQAASSKTVDNAIQANQNLQEADRLMTEIADKSSEIARATEQQAEAATEANMRINALSGAADSSLRTADELAAASQALRSSCLAIMEIANRFKL
ncbi:methyl-accepting chemotaxis protein [Alteromonas mediterranea]|jgi:methyl-accepting chemotaxis protein|uniref:methyl-accepting chemotaxis protein n=1 Tax=Alteromonas mediterranea TaxID=314275 RepID=UPI0003556058|nr:methyl-accepting chemotaxis protein [Alteromonas mediterranea]AGP88510.1 chemotaxis sensory protein [Alteromonas mediterranea U7]AGP92386.1 chemotaxis sensory protein [Alteromonas mediterranea U8]MBR9898204.1 methyl-accepting chemotaxis protein [Gammaproteobacteria bacterium]MDY6882997.1 methyl-accepting chemotaxis protein [Pseudomonadota bacterium]|tara:strand:+ start:5430 stop:7052 length:1623 start_codon:yes stop_codon:yes gene_type:complete